MSDPYIKCRWLEIEAFNNKRRFRWEILCENWWYFISIHEQLTKIDFFCFKYYSRRVALPINAGRWQTASHMKISDDDFSKSHTRIESHLPHYFPFSLLRACLVETIYYAHLYSCCGWIICPWLNDEMHGDVLRPRQRLTGPHLVQSSAPISIRPSISNEYEVLEAGQQVRAIRRHHGSESQLHMHGDARRPRQRRAWPHLVHAFNNKRRFRWELLHKNWWYFISIWKQLTKIEFSRFKYYSRRVGLPINAVRWRTTSMISDRWWGERVERLVRGSGGLWSCRWWIFLWRHAKKNACQDCSHRSTSLG